MVRSREFGASGFIPKSSSLEVIQKAVRSVLDGDVWWPPQAFEAVSVSDEAKAASAGLASLTPQQFRVLTMVCEGLLNKQIAYELGISEKTVKMHRARVVEKMHSDSVAELVRLAEKVGISPAAGSPPQP